MRHRLASHDRQHRQKRHVTVVALYLNRVILAVRYTDLVRKMTPVTAFQGLISFDIHHPLDRH